MKPYPVFCAASVVVLAVRAAHAQEPEPAPPAAPSEPAAPPEAAAPAAPSQPAEAATPSEAATPPPVLTPAGETSRAEKAERSTGTAAPELLRLSVGLRVGYVATRGFDTFSSDDVLPQLSIAATHPFVTSGRFSLAAGLGWDYGRVDDRVRYVGSELSAHRFSVPIEGRWRLSSLLLGFVKVAPGVAAMLTEVGEPTQRLSATGWAFSADASAGASILLVPQDRIEKRRTRLWLTPEIGYAFTTSAALNANLGREDEEILGSDEDLKLRSLALSGLFWRASIGATF